MEGKDWLRRVRTAIGLGNQTQPDPDWPAWYRRYYDLNGPGKQDDLDLGTADIVVLDAETTGLEVKTDRILSIGALRIRSGVLRLEDQLEGYLENHSSRTDAAAVAIHGIIPNSRRYEYSTEEALLSKLVEYLGSAIIVGHHIGFDVEMINLELERLGAGPLRNRVVDTARLAQRLQPAGYWSPRDHYTLDSLARRYRIPLSDRHTALGDAFITGVLYLKLLAQLRVRLQRPVTLGDL